MRFTWGSLSGLSLADPLEIALLVYFNYLLNHSQSWSSEGVTSHVDPTYLLMGPLESTHVAASAF